MWGGLGEEKKTDLNDKDKSANPICVSPRSEFFFIYFQLSGAASSMYRYSEIKRPQAASLLMIMKRDIKRSHTAIQVICHSTRNSTLQ